MDFVMGHREGPWLADLDGGKRLYNLHCNGGVFNLGHRNPELVAILTRALQEADIGNHHLMSRARAELAAQLAGLLPGDLSYAVFGVSGGEAVDLAIKVARAATGRGGIVSARGGYHGHTGLALAAGDERYRAPFGPAAPGFAQVGFGDLEAMEGAVGGDTAAVLLETVPATLGMVVPATEYLQGVRELCSRRGALLVLDEVQAGLGRSGRLWAFEHFGVTPDILVLGKGLSGGLYPITATVLRRDLEAVFRKDPFVHVSTFGAGRAAALAQRVHQISSDPSFSPVNALAGAFREGVARLRERHRGFLTGFRQLGLLMGLELRDELAGPILTRTAYDHDLLLIYANNDTSVCQLLPPLVMPLEDVPWVLERLDEALRGSAPRPLVEMGRGVRRLSGESPGDRPRLSAAFRGGPRALEPHGLGRPARLRRDLHGLRPRERPRPRLQADAPVRERVPGPGLRAELWALHDPPAGGRPGAAGGRHLRGGGAGAAGRALHRAAAPPPSGSATP
jgi:acetylornithine/succinyldiaminopimelate/putrescine aminotransferase